MAEGTPEDVVKAAGSFAGQYLTPLLGAARDGAVGKREPETAK